MPKTSIWIYLKSENLISIWKSIILSENLFQTWIIRSGAMVCIQVYHDCDEVEYTHIEPLCEVHVWNQFSDKIIYFQI